MRLSLCLAVLPLLACDAVENPFVSSLAGTSPVGEVTLCLGASDGVPAAAGELVAFTGRVLPATEGGGHAMVDDVWPCDDTPDEVFAIGTDDGTRYTLGVSWRVDGDRYGWAFLEEGALTEVDFRVGENGRAAGVVVHQDGELALVVEHGVGGPGLQAEDLPGGLVVVTDGDRGVATADGRYHSVVTFETLQDQVEVEPGGDAGLVVDDVHVSACPAASWTEGDDSELSWFLL